MRLIDSDELVQKYGAGLTPKMLHRIQQAPTVDAVPVVRCKDCIYSTERYGHIECIHGISYRNSWNKPEDFCSYGERKEGDE